MGDSLSMLRNVLDVCRVSGVRLLYMSSWEVYSGYRAREISADESLPQRPKGPYGETKVLAESLLEHQRSMHGLDYTIVRASPVYGEGSDKPKFLHTFVRKALAGVPVIRTHRYSNGLPMLDLLDVDDLIGLVASVIAEKAEGAFNVGGGKLYSTAEIAKMVGKLCGVECRIEFEEIDDAIANVLMDSSRARALLGWKPTANFEDKLNELVARHRAELS
jgi:UDP-glucuronate decarboxylase